MKRLILAAAIVCMALPASAAPKKKGLPTQTFESVVDICATQRNKMTREQVRDVMIDRKWTPPDEAWAMPGGETWKWNNRRADGTVEKGTSFYVGFMVVRQGILLSGCEECKFGKCGPDVK